MRDAPEGLRAVEYVPGVGLKPVCAGDTLVRYRLGTHKPCAACNHRHRFDAPDGEGGEIVFDAACPECPCRANGARYDAGIYHDLDQYTPARCEHHDLPGPYGADDHDGPSFGPRAIDDSRMGHGDSRGTRCLVQGRELRRGGLDWLKRIGIPGFARDQRPQLGDGGRLESSSGRRSGDPGLADHRGDADTERPTGSVGLRSLVGPRGWMA